MPLVDYTLKGNIPVKRYVIDEDVKPTAVVFGKFSPWTGPNGHGKLVDYAKENFDEVVIVSPTRKAKDKKVDIFTDEQKEKIINKANPDIKFHRIPSDIPIRMFTEVLGLGYERPVLIVGEDRGKSFSRFFIHYDENNKAITDQDNKELFGKGEYLVVPRGDEDTSATKVREALEADDKETFIELTGYDEAMWKLMKSFLKKNLGIKESFCYFYSEGE